MENIHERHIKDLKYQRVTINEPKKIGKMKSQNNFQRTFNNYNNLILNNNNYDMNYRNYIESSIIGDRDVYPEEKGRNTCYFINKSSNLNPNIIPIYDYDNNYDFYYKYNANQIPNDSLANLNNNYNY